MQLIITKSRGRLKSEVSYISKMKTRHRLQMRKQSAYAACVTCACMKSHLKPSQVPALRFGPHTSSSNEVTVILIKLTFLSLIMFFYETGHSTSYWPLDNHLNLVNLRRDMWGKFVGDVGTTHGPRLGAVYTHGDVAVIKLGEVDDVCFTEPMSCNNGFTVSLWLKQRRAHYIKPEQLLVAIGDYKNGSYTLKVFIKSKRPEEHLGVRVSASSRKCVKIFLVPRSVWSLFTFVWNTTDVNVYRNGLKVNEFLVEYCVDEQSQGALQHPTITLKGDAMFDDLQIWSRALSANEIGEMFACVRGNISLYLGLA